MSFSTQKRKLYTLWSGTQSNSFRISDNIDTNEIIFRRVADLNNEMSTQKAFVDLSSAWVIPDSLVDENNGYAWKLFAQYKIRFTNMADNLIPYLSSHVSYRVGDDVPSAPVPPSSDDPDLPFDETLSLNTEFKRNECIQRSGSDTIFISSIYLQNGSGLPDNLQFKFYFRLFNKYHFQSS